jgi:hypothetical protein
VFPPGPPWRNITSSRIRTWFLKKVIGGTYLAFRLGCRIAHSVICGLSLRIGSPCQREGRGCILGLAYQIWCTWGVNGG